MRVTWTGLDRWDDYVYVSESHGSPMELWIPGLDDFRRHLELIDTIEYTKYSMIERFLQRKKARRIGPNRLSV